MTPNLPQLEDELKYLGYRVPQIVLRSWPAKSLQHKTMRWCWAQLNPPAKNHSGRPVERPDWLERFAVKRKGTWLC